MRHSATTYKRASAPTSFTINLNFTFFLCYEMCLRLPVEVSGSAPMLRLDLFVVSQESYNWQPSTHNHFHCMLW